MRQRNKLYAIVEGHGEADRSTKARQPAITMLVRRLLRQLECYSLFPAEKTPPFRLSYGDFFRPGTAKFENAIRYHTQFPDCAGLLVMLDMDDDCAKQRAFELATRVAALGQLPFSVTIVCAVREYETWFLASLESIHPNTIYNENPEVRRGAKEWLRKQFGYRSTRDQADYTARLDLAVAYTRSRSFRRLQHAIEEIIVAHEVERVVITPIARPNTS